jgi:hypothetical protein
MNAQSQPPAMFALAGKMRSRKLGSLPATSTPSPYCPLTSATCSSITAGVRGRSSMACCRARTISSTASRASSRASLVDSAIA